MTDWADEAVKEIGKVIRSGWDMEENLAKILRKAKADGMQQSANRAFAYLTDQGKDIFAMELYALLSPDDKIEKGDPDEGLPTAEDVRGILKGEA